MKTWVLLRSAHKGKENRTGSPPSGDLDKCEDMWTILFDKALQKIGNTRGIIIKVGQSYSVRYKPYLIECRLSDLITFSLDEVDLIINRGGYIEYMPFCELYSSTPLIYLGCGMRWNPYNEKWAWLNSLDPSCILVDSKQQKEEIGQLANVEIFPKPALDHLFYPRNHIKKQYDLVYNCHRPDAFKGGPWLAPRIPDGCKVLVIGPENKWLKKESDSGRINVAFTGTVLKSEVPVLASQAKVGVVCDDGLCDSGPRVLPEFLAMDIPVIVRNTVRADLDNYIKPLISGMVVGDDSAEFKMALKRLLRNKSGKARDIYKASFNLDCAADRLIKISKGIG